MNKRWFHLSSTKFLICILFVLYFLILLIALLNYFLSKRLRESSLENIIEIKEEFFKKTIVDYANFHKIETDLSRLKNEFSQKAQLGKIYIINSYGLIVSSSEPSDLMSQIQNPKIIQALKDGRQERISLQSKSGERRYLSVVPLKNNQLCLGCHEVKKKSYGAILFNFAVQENIKMGISSHLNLLLLLISSFVPFISFFILKNKFIAPIKNFKGKMEKVIENSEEGGIKSIIQYAKYLEEKTHQQKIEISFLKQAIEEKKSELRNTYEKIMHSEKLASLGTLLAGLSHEINNPVGTIISRCDCLILEAGLKNLAPEVVEDLQIIKSHAKRIANLIYTLLNFSKIPSDEKKECNLNEIIEKTLVLVEPQFRKDGINIIKKLMFGLPKVLANDIQMQQVFLNILLNARDATPIGGTIWIESQAPLHDEKFVKVIISDNGLGIPKEYFKRIYEPFFTTKKNGTGLGLFLCYSIIRVHGGEMEIQSEEGKGTKVFVKLPCLNREESNDVRRENSHN